jgi:hypothetical protein
LVVTALGCLAQQNDKVVLVGVAVMENHAGRSVPGNVEQDRLVKAINQLKPDKKTHVKVEAVPLPSASDGTSQEEAQKQNCQYIVYTRLIELRNATDPYQRVPGTIETNPNSQWANRDERSQIVDPEFRATVDYKLTTVSGAAVAGAPYSTQQINTDEIGTVSMIMDRIANAVVAEVKKSPPPMQEHDTPR